MRSYPQPEFSLAKRTMSASTSGAIGGRPGKARYLEPSKLRAMSRRYQARMVSGLAMLDTCWSALRPSRLPISERVDRHRRVHTGREARSQDAVFGGELFVLEQ
jgi:hypothetical protein